MWCLYRNLRGTPPVSSAQCPVRLGRVIRVCTDMDPPLAVVVAYWPILKPHKFGDRVNLFGTWVRTSKPIVSGAGPTPTAQATSGSAAAQYLMVSQSDVLVWPIDVDRGSQAFPDGVRIPFSALEYLRETHAIDLALPMWTFSDRGKEFFKSVIWKHHADEQPPQ